MTFRINWLIVLLLFWRPGAVLASDTCEVCGETIEGTVYFWPDKVANVKKRVCHKCVELPTTCYLCSMPVAKNYTVLPDGRILCERDAQTVVLTKEEADRICEQTQRVLDRLFSRFINFPDRNVTVALADRVNLINLFQIPGKDYECPNVLGYYNTKTNSGSMTHEISLLSGLPAEVLKSTYSHEITHAWVAEAVPLARRKRMNHNAEEGFCELVAYLLANEEGDEESKKTIKLNAYTRGQFELFLAAEEKYGFNEVAEWMKQGEDDVLMADDLSRVRRIRPPAVSNAPPLFFPPPVVPQLPPETLTLKGIMWSRTRPMALINDRTFEPKEEGKVRLGQTNVTIRCLSIREDSVVIQVAGSEEQQTLRLKGVETPKR
jgi:hypothetical protein